MTYKYSLTLIFTVVTFLFTPLLTELRAMEIRTYPVLTESQTFTQEPYLNTVYHYKHISVPYQDGEVYISGSPDGLTPVFVGEEIDFFVQQSNKFYKHVIDCTPTIAKQPLNITHLLVKGQNSIQVRFRRTNHCNPAHTRTIGPVYAVHYDTYTPSPQFMDLPWDYTSRGMNFTEAAQSMTSWFDHEYPLLSSGLSEPLLLMPFNNVVVNEDPYSSHDGYDWAAPSRLKLGDSLLASAPGYAKYVNTCAPCGNAVHIDHQNGYQSRYYHLQSEGLVVNQPGSQLWVTDRQKIGQMGATGNVWPEGDTGAHIHFMVIHDKNADGNFEDNIPDGVVDPFGWKPISPDPWENYSFTYAGQNRTGSKSLYLWKNPVGKYMGTVANDLVNSHTYQKAKLEFQKNTVNRYTILDLSYAPPESATLVVNNQNVTVHSLSNVLNVVLKDATGVVIETLLKTFKLTLKYNGIDTSRYIPESLVIYSSSDEGESWQKETTTIDPINKTAIANVNHFSQFAIMGEKLDSIAPETSAALSGVLQEAGSTVYLDTVTAALESVDLPTEHSLGIEYLLYSLENDGIVLTDWSGYTEPLILNTPGSYKLSYYAADNDGNIEELKVTEFSIAVVPTLTPTQTPTPEPTATPTSTPTPTATLTPSPTPMTVISPTPTKIVQQKPVQIKIAAFIKTLYNLIIKLFR